MKEVLLGVVLGLGIFGCGSTDEKPSGASPPELGPGAFEEDFRDSGRFFTRMTEPRRGLASSPHGVVQIFYSNNVQPLIGKEAFEVAPGTVAIKPQDQNDDGVVDTIQVMIKKDKGYDDLTHDWLYERYTGTGRLDVSGGPQLNFCRECHNGFAETSELAGSTLAN